MCRTMVSKRLLLEVVLVIILSIVPFSSGSNFSADRLALVPFFADLLLYLLGDLLLLLILIEDC